VQANNAFVMSSSLHVVGVLKYMYAVLPPGVSISPVVGVLLVHAQQSTKTGRLTQVAAPLSDRITTAAADVVQAASTALLVVELIMVEEDVPALE